MSEFILRLADIKAWLESTEQRISGDMKEHERIVLFKVRR